jgi:alpha-methylacyl-CoA racemase
VKPLQGVKILSLALNLPGPLVAREVRLLGAQVFKIEPHAGDPVQSYFPKLYADLHKGQKILKLDLKEKLSRKKLDVLLAKADLLLTSSRASALKSLGLTKSSLQKRFPRLSHVAITGYLSPHGSKPGHDLTYQASKGLIRPPELPVTLWADIAGAQKAVAICLACLYQKEKTKRGVHMQVSLAEALDFFALPLKYSLTTPGSLLGGGSPRYGLYQAKDGWIAVAALEEHFWKKLLVELGSEGERAALEKIFLEKPAADWQNWAEELDLPIVAVKRS